MGIFTQENIDNVQKLVGSKNGNGYINSVPVINEPAEKQINGLQTLMDKMERVVDFEMREMMQDCVHEMLTFYGDGLKRILDIVSEANNGAVILNRLIEDDFVSSLLLIHDLHPLDVKTRLYQALAKVKPYIDGHGGQIEIVNIENGIATIKLSGTCKGCPSSANTLELGIRKVVEEQCPDIFRLEIVGIAEEIIEMEM